MPVVYFFITQNIITKDHHNITIISKNPDPTLSKLNINNLTNYFNKKKLSHDKIIFNYSILIFEHVYDDIINVQRCKNEHILDSHYIKNSLSKSLSNHNKYNLPSSFIVISTILLLIRKC